MRTLLLLFSVLTLIACSDSTNQLKKTNTDTTTPKSRDLQLSYYKCDYLKSHYDTILSAVDEHNVHEVWGISKSDITQIPLINNNDLDSNDIIKSAEIYLKKRFQDIHLRLTDFKIEKITDLDSSNPKNKFIEVTFLYNEKGSYQIVPLLMDGRIVLSNKE
jgi:hypothetical protein